MHKRAAAFYIEKIVKKFKMFKYTDHSKNGITKKLYAEQALNQNIRISTDNATVSKENIYEKIGICKANKIGYHNKLKKYIPTKKTKPRSIKFSTCIENLFSINEFKKNPADTPRKNRAVINNKLKTHIGGKAIFSDIM